MKMKKLNLGNSDFKSIVENNNYFVDKSLFIKEVIDSQSMVILLPRPRRFGKMRYSPKLGQQVKVEKTAVSINI